VLYLWQIAKGAVIITTSSKRENIQKMVVADGLDSLSQEEVDEIEKVGRGVHWRSSTVSEGRALLRGWTLFGDL
jgi:diketogulonate reductase-like aldo/keto reductase